MKRNDYFLETGQIPWFPDSKTSFSERKSERLKEIKNHIPEKLPDQTAMWLERTQPKGHD
jgi:hypothetical protein